MNDKHLQPRAVRSKLWSVFEDTLHRSA